MLNNSLVFFSISSQSLVQSRKAGITSAMATRSSLKDEELVSRVAGFPGTAVTWVLVLLFLESAPSVASLCMDAWLQGTLHYLLYKPTHKQSCHVPG